MEARPLIARRDGNQEDEMKLLVVHGEGLGNIVEALPLLRTLDKAGIEADLFLARATSEFSRDFLKGRRVYLEGDAVDDESYDGKIETIWGNVQGRSQSLSGIKTVNDLAKQTMRLDTSEVDVYLNAARDLGIKEDAFEYDCRDELNTVLPEKTYDVVFANGYNWRVAANRWEMKSYPRFTELAQELLREGKSVCSVGAPHEHIEGTENETARPLAETCGLLKAAKVVVSTDSGVYHCACALGIPTVVIFTFTGIRKNYDKRFHQSAEIIRVPVDCHSDCHAKMKWMKCDRDVCRDIPVKIVMEAIRRQYAV